MLCSGIASKPHSAHVYTFPSCGIADVGNLSAWAWLLLELESFVDASDRPRHLPSLSDLRRAGRTDIVDALRAISARLEADFR